MVVFGVLNIKSCKRQYIGKTIDGKKVLHCNFIGLLDDNMHDLLILNNDRCILYHSECIYRFL